MAVSIIGPKFYAWDSDTGKPLAFGKVYTYQAGTNTPKATFTTEGGETQNANPVILNGAGYADIFLNGSYKVVVKDADDVEVWTSDPVSDPSQLQQEWVRQRNITQVNTTTFTVDGELTDEYVKGVAVRVKQDSGFVTGTVASATYADGKTTVTLGFLGTETITVSAVYAERALVSFQSLPKNLVIYVDTVADMKALSDVKSGQNIYLSDGGRSGMFEYLAGDYSAEVAADTLEGVYVKLDAVAATVGVLKRSGEKLTIEHFGGVPGEDSTSAWAGVASYLNFSGDEVIIPVGGFYVSSAPAIYRGTVRHENGGIIINNANDGTNFWNNTCVFYGSYFGYNAGVLLETGYAMSDVSEGNLIPLATPSDSANFSVGDIVFCTGGEKYPTTDFYTTSFVSIVTDVGPGVVTVRDSITTPLISGAETCKIYRQSGTLVSTDVGKPPLQKMANGLKVVNGQYKSESKTFSQTVHISAIDSNIDLLEVTGRDAIGANPFAHSHIDLHRCNFYRRGLEIAYFHYNVTSNTIDIRQATISGDTVQDINPFTIGEWGEGCNFGDVHVDTSRTLATANNSNINFLTPNHTFKRLTSKGGAGNGVSFPVERGSNISIGVLEVKDPSLNGVKFSSSNVTVQSLIIDGIDAAKSAAVIASGVSGVSILSGLLGDGAGSGEQYVVIDENKGVGNNVNNVTNHFSQEYKATKGFSAINGTGAMVDIDTYLIAAGTSTKNAQFSVKVFGNISAGSTTGAKTIRLTIGANNFDLTAIASETGFFSFNVRFYKGDSNTANQGVVGEIKSGWASDQNVLLGLSNNMASSDLSITLSANLVVGDTVNIREFEVTPTFDQINF